MSKAIVSDQAFASPGQCLRFHPSDSVFDAYLSRTPFSHALFRAAEVASLANLSLPRPVLDVGCGAGEFASLGLDDQVDVGVDVCEKQLGRALSTGCYASLHHADARCLPFPDESFNSVFSLSVLEHIASPSEVIKEVFRVLRPGGLFVGTVVLSDLHNYLYYPNLCRRVGLGLIGRAYRWGQDRFFKHRTMYTKEVWEEIFLYSGFEVEESRRIISPSVTALWDFGLPAAVPYQLLSWLGRPRVWHPRWFRSWASRHVRGILANEADAGGVLLFVAKKPVHHDNPIQHGVGLSGTSLKVCRSRDEPPESGRVLGCTVDHSPRES